MYGVFQDLIFLFKITMDKLKDFFTVLDNLGTHPQNFRHP